jgi:hypothetical protein
VVRVSDDHHVNLWICPVAAGNKHLIDPGKALGGGGVGVGEGTRMDLQEATVSRLYESSSASSTIVISQMSAAPVVTHQHVPKMLQASGLLLALPHWPWITTSRLHYSSGLPPATTYPKAHLLMSTCHN